MDLNSRYMFLIDLVLLPPIKVKTKFDDDEPEPTIFGCLFKILYETPKFALIVLLYSV